MKKNLTLLAVLIVLFSSHVFAGTAIGAEFGAVIPVYHSKQTTDISLTFKSDRLPFVIQARSQFVDWKFSSAGATMDMWLANPVIGISLFHFYYGPGLTVLYYPRVDSKKLTQSTGLFVAPRFVLGVNSYLTDFLELYAQAAVEPGVLFDADDGFKFRVNIPVGTGIRFWF